MRGNTRRTIAAVEEIDLAIARDKARAWLVRIRKGEAKVVNLVPLRFRKALEAEGLRATG
jgi:hypothetical protein